MTAAGARHPPSEFRRGGGSGRASGSGPPCARHRALPIVVSRDSIRRAGRHADGPRVPPRGRMPSRARACPSGPADVPVAGSGRDRRRRRRGRAPWRSAPRASGSDVRPGRPGAAGWRLCRQQAARADVRRWLRTAGNRVCCAGRAAFPAPAAGAACPDGRHHVGGHRCRLAGSGGGTDPGGAGRRGPGRGAGRAAQPVRAGSRRAGRGGDCPGGDRVRRREHQRRGGRACALGRGCRAARPSRVPGGEHA